MAGFGRRAKSRTPKTRVFRRSPEAMTCQASGGSKSPDLLLLLTKSEHLRTTLEIGIPEVHENGSALYGVRLQRRMLSGGFWKSLTELEPDRV